MNRKAFVKMHLRALFFDARERLIDLVNVAFPIFVVMGFIVAAAKFWWWLL